MYRHDRVMRVMADVECVVRDLFAHYFVRSADFVGGTGVRGMV